MEGDGKGGVRNITKSGGGKLRDKAVLHRDTVVRGGMITRLVDSDPGPMGGGSES